MLLDEIGAALATGGAGTLGTNLFTAFMPDAPDALVAVYETRGAPSLTLLGAAVFAERPRIQVLSRGAPDDYVGARTKSWTAYSALKGAGGADLTNVRYLAIEPTSVPYPLDKDERGRWIFVFNCDVLKEEE